MATPEPQFFDVVRIGESDDARKFGLNGAEGIVIGVSEDEITGDKRFLLRFEDSPPLGFDSRDLTPTGRSVTRESIYSGDSVRVSQQGHILGYNSAGPQQADDDA